MGEVTKLISIYDLVLTQDNFACIKRQPIRKGNLIAHLSVVICVGMVEFYAACKVDKWYVVRGKNVTPILGSNFATLLDLKVIVLSM